MKVYAALSEGFKGTQEQELMTLFFNQLSQHFQNNKNITIDKKNKKIWQRDKLFFYFNKKTRLIETERMDEFKITLLTSSKANLKQSVIGLVKLLNFSFSATEAYMLSHNGLLFSETPRIYQAKDKKTLLFYDGVVSTEFALKELFTKNSGLIVGHVHTDFSSYSELCELLPILQQQGLKTIYLELPYYIFSELFKHFNKNKDSNLSQVLAELRKNKLFKDEIENDINKQIVANLRKLFISAKKASINIYACDIDSLNFTDSKLKQLNTKHRLKVGDACMIRSIEKLQSDQKHPKFLALLGLAHAKNIAQALGVPSCFLGEKKQSQIHQEYMLEIDYRCFSENKSLYPSGATPFLTLSCDRFEQNKDPKIKEIIDYWDKLIQEMPATFLNIPAPEVKSAREVYIEYILEKSLNNKLGVSITCNITQSLVVEYLSKAIYAKSSELIHPKNWPSLFRCTRPYGIRLAENEANTFSTSNLNSLELAQPSMIKPHHA